MTKKEIGKLIRNARLKREWTLQQLAEKIGVTAASVSRWENGEKSILGESLVKIATVLEITSELFPGYVKADASPNASSDASGKTVTREEFEVLRLAVERILKDQYHPMLEMQIRCIEKLAYHKKFPPDGVYILRNLDTDEVYFRAEDLLPLLGIKKEEIQETPPET